jgi:hypothetical protein
MIESQSPRESNQFAKSIIDMATMGKSDRHH